MKKTTIDIDGIKREVLAADLHTIEGTSKLETILMTRYPARDVATFAGLAHQYQSTPNAVRNFRTMFARVMRKYETYRVLAADMGICDSRRVGECLFIDESDTEPNLLDYTIATIMRKVEAARKEQDKASRKKTRADAGKKHRKHKKIKGAWRSAADVAGDFNKSAFMPKGKGKKRKLGTCDEKKINGWDARYPDFAHRNKWGYYAELRIDSNLKEQYNEVLRNWAAHWADYKAWNEQHPNAKYRPARRTDIDPDRIGVDENGVTYVRPRADKEVFAQSKRMRRCGLKPHYRATVH